MDHFARPSSDAPPLVSVVVLNFNGESIIQRCIECLLAQTYANFEIIVVDNSSSDASCAIVKKYLNTGRITLVQSERNLGVPGGRNLGLLHVEGRLVAFIDNDGYAHRDWLTEGVKTLSSDDKVGAVAPLVFFARNPLVLNGAGGTVNFLGYGGDLCFNAPYEYAALPSEVLYPMGCGMIFRRSVLDLVGQFDACLFNYYDDADMGMRIWKAGYKVMVSPRSWVDHDFSYTDGILRNKVFLCERNRLRTVIKHFSGRYIRRWLGRELLFSARYLRAPALRSIPIRAWCWNLRHLICALHWRLRIPSDEGAFYSLMEPTWADYPLPTASNRSFRPSIRHASSTLIIDGEAELSQLEFGWYFLERDGAVSFRWTERFAASLFRLASASCRLCVRMRAASPRQHLAIHIRPFGRLAACLTKTVGPVSSLWSEHSVEVRLEPGLYEVVLRVSETVSDASGRLLGVAVSRISFDHA